MLATTNTPSAAQRSASFPPLQSSSTINTGIRTTRTNVILLAVVINIILRNSYQFSIIHIDDAHAHKVARFDMLL